MKTIWIRAGMSAALLATAIPAMAHMPYVLPNMFDAGERKSVALEASFTEDAFRPDIAMNDAPFEMTVPDGSTMPIAGAVVFKSLTVVEAPLAADGVYRLSSGQRLGRMGKMYREGAQWKMVGEGAAAPASAKLVDVQSTTLADAYVLKGKPSSPAALAPRGKALEIHPMADPTGIAAGAPFPIEILYKGKGLADAKVSLFREAGYYDGKKVVGEFTADEAGKVSITPPDAG